VASKATFPYKNPLYKSFGKEVEITDSGSVKHDSLCQHFKTLRYWHLCTRRTRTAVRLWTTIIQYKRIWAGWRILARRSSHNPSKRLFGAKEFEYQPFSSFMLISSQIMQNTGYDFGYYFKYYYNISILNSVDK